MNWIRDSYQRPEFRVMAIRVLNISKTLLATDITAAFGGRPTYLPGQLEEIKRQKELLQHVVIREIQEPQDIPDGGYKYAWEDVAGSAKNIRLPRLSAWSCRQPRTLDDNEFSQFKGVMELVKDGKLGQLVDSMTEVFASKGIDLPTRQEFLELEADINNQLRSFAPIGPFLTNAGTLLINYSEKTPSDEVSFTLTQALGHAAFGLQALVERVVLPLFRKHPRRLYGNWEMVKNALRLER